jgi:hypothetical protein
VPVPNETLVSEIDKALETHSAWRKTLTRAIRTGRHDTPADDLACDEKCAFGQWLNGPALDADIKARKPYQITRRLHAEFHDVAARVAKLAEDGRRSEAFRLLDTEYTARSDTLNRALKNWRGEITRDG